MRSFGRLYHSIKDATIKPPIDPRNAPKIVFVSIQVIFRPSKFLLPLILTHPKLLQLIARCLDADALFRWRITEPLGDAILQRLHVVILKLDHFLAIDADEVVVVGAIDEIRVVRFMVLAEVDLF